MPKKCLNIRVEVEDEYSARNHSDSLQENDGMSFATRIRWFLEKFADGKLDFLFPKNNRQ